ncbi:MAG: prealbumin-like fold domain-containing protein, partial [Finegoldia magna]|nr:prealbumin-like fold domain-containing protein [Finegoldia magna]
LVKVKAKVGDKQSVSLDYDWLTTENTANQTKLTQSVILNKTNGQGTGEKNQILVTNEEFAKSPISATKFGDTFNADGNRERLQGAEFVLKDSKNNVIANKFTDKNGTADFGQFPPGTYRLEEKSAPDGYQKNGVYFEVVVDEQGQVTYKAKFEDGIGTPQVGQDYYIEKGEETESSAKAKVTSVNQRLEYLENEPGDIGTKTGVWEAYSYESLKYHADVTLTNVSEGSRFEIQFDRNLDFTQYFSAFPKIKIDGVEVADPYFDYNTNLLTYVFNDKAKKDVTASINLRGIIPDKYFARETGKYTFTIKVATGGTKVDGNPVLNQEINADYGRHHSGTGDSNQSYYFRDVYQKKTENGM